MAEKTEKLNKLARDVLILSRNTLLVNLRFLDAALSKLKYVQCDNGKLMTDGVHLIYEPRHVLDCYKLEKEVPVRDYLHIVMHCVFRHMFMDPSLNRTYWDLACDMAVEAVITELDLKAVTAKRQNMQTGIFSTLTGDMKQLTAEKLYHSLVENNIDPVEAARLRGHFFADNHECWYMTEDEMAKKFGVEISAGQGQNTGTESSGDTTSLRKADVISDWTRVSERMQVDIETFGKIRGTKAGRLVQNLSAVNREKYDYTAFLKKFAVMGEAMKINDDEFDYIFYTYGLQLYDKMPLIEPLEYKEVKAIKEFVIAIDTSGSTSGELVQKFVQKTYNILKSTESFFSKINLHIIQCDAEIQEDAKITCQEDFDEYLKTMRIRGLGGTDFRPVFEYVEQLRKNREFTNLKGLIYFTDGYGEFPAKKPDYDTAFVFVDDEYNNPDVPPWAIKLVLQKDEI